MKHLKYTLLTKIAGIEGIEFLFTKLRNKVLLLKGDFDIEWFCKFTDSIIESQNCSTLQKLLTMLYGCVDIFTGSAREYFFLKYLLSKRFNDFALFWEDNIVGLFIQLLLFKGTQAKMKNLEANTLEESEIEMYNVQGKTESGLTAFQLDMFVTLFRYTKERRTNRL